MLKSVAAGMMCLGLATLGNIVGGAVFVAGVYWVGSPAARAKVVPEPSANGVAGVPVYGSRSAAGREP